MHAISGDTARDITATLAFVSGRMMPHSLFFGYDSAGNPTSVSNTAAVWTYGYNKRGLLESEQVVIDSMTRVFDPAYNTLGQLDNMTTPAHSLSYAPDAWGRPTQLGAHVTAIQYHPNGLPSSYTYGNELTYTQSLDSRLRPSEQNTLDGSTPIQKFVYGYYPSGQLQSIYDPVNNTDDMSATYDDLHRLETAAGVWGTYTYAYDTLNNIRARSGPNALSYSYNGVNQLSSVSGAQSRSYSYNARGDVTGDGSKIFTLNSKGQIGAITGVVTYAYDGNAKRIKTVKSGISEYTMYSHAGAMTFVQKSTEMTDELALGGQILVELKKVSGVDTPTYLHPDLLGSPRAATDAAKNVLWREIYDPYGVKLNGVADKVGYTGHAHDQETGYSYMQARFYDARVGRFLSTDPVDDEFNLYGYVGNDPLNKTDPLGLFDWQAFGSGMEAGMANMQYGAVDHNWGSSTEHTWGYALGGALTAMAENAGGGRGGSGRMPCACFAAGTSVVTEKGPRPIETLRVGDVVLAHDPSTGETAFKPITEIFVNDEKSIWELEIVDTSGGRETQRVTNVHPYWVVGIGWVEAGQLVPGMRLMTISGMEVTVGRITDTGEVERTYNFSVRDLGTYFVGQKPVLVHNCPRGPAGSTLPANKVQGKVGESITRGTLGNNIRGEQVTLVGSNGARAKVDFVVKGPAVVESKTGAANLSPGQQVIKQDIDAGRAVTPVGQNAAAGLKPGQPVVMKGCLVDHTCPK
jgi:RHS repeat-associated protein